MTNWWQKLEELRQKPEEKRRRILWWSTSLITLLIVLIWLLAWRWTNAPIITPETASSTINSEDGTNWLADVKLKIITGWKTLIPTK